MNKEIKKLQIIREKNIKLLYRLDLLNESPSDLFKEAIPDTTINSDNIKTVSEIYNHLFEIDYVIESNLTKWKINRLEYINRAIIRYATYEMLFTDTPKEIIINEAVEITKKLADSGDGKAKGFTNKVLDNIKNSL